MSKVGVLDFTFLVEFDLPFDNDVVFVINILKELGQRKCKSPNHHPSFVKL
jgi:hypothetical protein